MAQIVRFSAYFYLEKTCGSACFVFASTMVHVKVNADWQALFIYLEIVSYIFLWIHLYNILEICVFSKLIFWLFLFNIWSALHLIVVHWFITQVSAKGAFWWTCNLKIMHSYIHMSLIWVQISFSWNMPVPRDWTWCRCYLPLRIFLREENTTFWLFDEFSVEHYLIVCLNICLVGLCLLSIFRSWGL